VTFVSLLCEAELSTTPAAYAPSFLSGQGTSLALVGAYVLAGTGEPLEPGRRRQVHNSLKLPDYDHLLR
jgi:hypothetical protein